MLHIVESEKSLAQISTDLGVAVVRHRFGVLGVHDLKAKMAEKGGALLPRVPDLRGL